MSNTLLLDDNISIYATSELIDGISLNYVLTNGGIAAVDVELKLILDQNGTPTTFQTWKRFSILPSENVYFEGTYFLTNIQLDQVTSGLNMTQKYQIICEYTGSSGDITKVLVPGASNYSVSAGHY